MFAGQVGEDEQGYYFVYDVVYLQDERVPAISFTLPKQSLPFRSKTMIPFFDGLIPEGWLLDIAVKNWSIKGTDRLGLLLTFCKDCIGAVSVQQETEGEE